MPNFEYYRKEYLGTAQARYEQAMAMAYRDLQLEYKDAAMVRNLLLEQMSQKELMQTKVLAQMNKVKASDKSDDEIARLLLAIGNGWSEFSKEENDIHIKNKEIQEKLRDEIEKKYSLDDSSLGSLDEFMLIVDRSAGRTGLTKMINDELTGTMAGLSQEQLEVVVSQYAPRIAHNMGVDVNTVANLLSGGKVLRYVSPDEIKQAIDDEYEDEIPGRLVYSSYAMSEFDRLLGESESEVKLLRQERNNRIRNEALGTTPTTTTTVKPPTEGIDGVPLPTPEKIRARAAEYYAPFASRDFQEVVGFREPAPPKPKAKPEIPEEEVEIAAIEGLPPFAGKLFGVSKEIESIVDLDDDTVLKQGGVGAQYGNQLLRSGDDYQSAVSKIEANESLDETQRQQAYAMLGRDLYRKFQEQSKTPSLEEIMLGRE
jgi:hypothetical protein